MSPLMGRPTLEGSHLIGRALLLLAALLLASAPLSQLLAGSSWLLLTFTAAAPVILGGIVLRRLLRPAMLVPLAQVGLIVVLVLVVEIAQGLTRWQDGPLQVLRDQVEIFSLGFNELIAGIAPLTLGAPGTVIVVVVIALVSLLLDLMYLDLGWHTPTGLLLMGAILVPALQQPSGGPWWHVAAPVLAGAAILVTRTVHADPSYLRGDRRPQAGPAAHPRRTLAASALCVLLVAGLSPLLGPALPQLAPARIALNIDLLERWQDPNAPALGPVMIDDDVSVRRSLLRQEDTEVLRYTTTATEKPSYLRLRTLNTFDGETFRGDAQGEEPVQGSAAFSDARDDGVPVRGSADDFIDTTIDITNFAGDRLPVPDNVREIQAVDRDLNRALLLQPSNGEVALNHVSAGLIGQRYTVASERRSSTAEELRAVDPAVFEQPFEVGYTSRGEVPEAAAELATTVAASAGAENGFDTAVAYQDYFRNSFAYSLTVNTAPGDDPLESFLTDRIGYCEQFAATFALMMTSQGYPSRVVIGFTAGEQDGDEWRVSAKNAHAWPEVWFGPQHGWVRFEPTPAAAANGVNPPGVTDASAPQDTPESAPENPESEQSTEETPNSQAGTTDEQTAKDTSTAEASDGGGRGPSQATVERLGGGVVGILGIGALLAAAAAAAVILIRHRRMQARDERWAALLGEGVGSGSGGGSGGGAGARGSGAASSAQAASSPAASALAVERMHRRAGELAWSELTRELAVRETAIRWLSITGAWGRPPTRIGLDPALPPARALRDLLDQIDAGTHDVTAEQRAAAGRIAAAYIAATYAAPLPEGPIPSPPPPLAPQHPLRRDSDLVIELIRTAR